MQDISDALRMIMQTQNCDALYALRLLYSEEEYTNAIPVLQSEPSEESSR